MPRKRADLLDYIHPIDSNPMQELRAAFGYLFGTSYRGIEIATVLKAKRLAKYVIFLAECNVFSDVSTKFILDSLPKLLKKVYFALYGCIDTVDGKIGLSHLRQVLPTVDTDGNICMICSGFNILVPMREYHNMRQQAYEKAESAVMQILAVFQIIIDEELGGDDWISEYSDDEEDGDNDIQSTGTTTSGVNVNEYQ
ncbi:MAG: hypothetical protein ACFFD4_08225 [Candidatus Odinarchaeota archaeon]